MPTRRAYVSATDNDLDDCLELVRMVLRDFGYQDVWEYLLDERKPIKIFLEELARCDLYIALIGWHYGYIPRENNPRGLSITELEYERAVELRKTRLIFVLSPAKAIDKVSSRISDFRERVLRENIVGFFTSPITLQSVLRTALENLDSPQPLVAPPPSPETIALIRSSPTPRSASRVCSPPSSLPTAAASTCSSRPTPRAWPTR